MINQRKMIDALLFAEMIFTRLASLMVRIFLATGQGLRSLLRGRTGRSLLTSREIYARNILKYWEEDGRGGTNRGIYIGRIGRYNSSRRLRIGQS